MDEITADSLPERALEVIPATRQTLRYQLDEMEVSVTCRLDTALEVKAVNEMRLQETKWRVSRQVPERASAPQSAPVPG